MRWKTGSSASAVPLLVIVGDEDGPCIDGSVFLKRTAPTAGLLVIPRSGHNIPSEEPAIFNAALADCLPPPKPPLAGAQTKKLICQKTKLGGLRWTSSSKARPRW